MEAKTVSYAFNSNTAGRSAPTAHEQQKTIAFFECADSIADLVNGTESVRIDMPLSPAGNGLDGELFSLPQNRKGAVKYATGPMGSRPKLSPSQFTVPPRHSGGANYAFLDGHVRWLDADHISSGTNARCSTDPQAGNVAGTAAGTALPNYTATFSIN